MSKTAFKTASDAVQKKLNEFADWILLYIPPEVKKPVNIRVEALKITVNDIYSRLRRLKVSNIQKKESAIKGF